jgi:hypothetical protein
MGIAYADVPDAARLTQENLINRGSFVDMATDLTDHVAVREMWKHKKKKFDGGDDWRFFAQVDHNHSAKAVGLYETDGTAIDETTIQLEVQPRHVNAHYVFDVREKAFQMGGHKIVDLIQTKYVGMMTSFFEKMESYLWGKPATSADERTPYGIAYWVTKGATASTFGSFTGLDPTGFSAGRAGKSSTDYPRWANYAAPYTGVTKNDLVRKMRDAHRLTAFRSPVSHANPDLGAMRNGIYTNNAVIGTMEEILEDQNMNLGNDMASKDGRTVFKSTPITYAPYLNLDSENPVYMLDWKWLAIGCLSGWENNLTSPYMVADKHNVRRVDLDATLQMVCTDLRHQAVFHVAP